MNKLILSQKRRSLHDTDSQNICSKLVAGYYMRLHKQDPDGEMKFKPWKYRYPLTTGKFSIQRTTGKVMISIICYTDKVSILNLNLTETPMSGANSAHLSMKLYQTSTQICHGKFVCSISRLHDSASAYNAKLTQDVIWQCVFRELLHPACHLTQTTSQCY